MFGELLEQLKPARRLTLPTALLDKRNIYNCMMIKLRFDLSQVKISIDVIDCI